MVVWLGHIANYDRDGLSMDSSCLDGADLSVGFFFILGRGGGTSTSGVKCQAMVNQWWGGKG